MVDQENGAGTIVTGGTVKSSSEWHFYYQGRTWRYRGTFNAKKILNCGKLKAGAYKFDLLNSRKEVLETATNDAQGNVKFTYTANYTDDDLGKTFTYYIREKLPDGANASNNYTVLDGSNTCTYDGHTATVTVTVKKTEDGKYEVERESDDTDTSGMDATFTNTINVPTTGLTVKKAWNTSNWPTDVASVQMTISAAGTETPIATLIANSSYKNAQVDLTSDNATGIWDNLPVYDNAGSKITYSVAETSVTMIDGTVYTADSTVKLNDVFTMAPETQGTTTTITNTPVTTHVPVDKAWLFANGSKEWPAGVDVTVRLMKKVGEGKPEEAGTVVLNAGKPSHDFINLPKYEGMNEIVYTVEEGEVTGLNIAKYDVSTSSNAEGLHILNEEKKAGLTITKTVNGKTVELTEKEKRSIVFEITGDSPFKKITKTLNDFTETNGIYTLTLDQSNGIEAGKTYTVTETGANLEKYTRVTKIGSIEYQQSAGNEIQPSAQVTVDAATGQGRVEVINTYTGEKVPVEVTKNWAKPGDLPANSSVTVKLSATVDGESYALPGVTTEQVLSGTTDPQWYYKWENLPKYDDNENLITYTVTETGITIAGTPVAEADLASYMIKADAQNTNYSFYLKNQIPTLTREALKRWSQDGHQKKLPENTSVKLKIKATTTKYPEDIFSKLDEVVGDQEQTLTGTDATAAGNWTAVWSGLPKYYMGEEITYTVTETEYKIGEQTLPVAVADNTPAEGFAFSFTNELPKITISGTKTWNIASDRIPDDPSLVLKRISAKPGAETEEVQVADGQPVWEGAGKKRTYTYSDLPKYDDEGHLYTYSVEETGFTAQNVGYTTVKGSDGTYDVTPGNSEAAHYSTTQKGNDIVNTELTSFDFTKKWQNMKGDVLTIWPAGKEIEVKIERIAGNDPDKDFALVYKLNGNANDKDHYYSSESGIAPEGKEGPVLKYQKDTAFSFHLEGLTKADGDTVYEYYISEKQIDGYEKPQYFDKTEKQVEEGKGLVGHMAPDGGIIVNTESTGYELPSTGGPGTVLYTVSGLLLIGAAILYSLMRHAGRIL